MQSRTIFEQCIRFVSELDGRESELDLASKMGVEVADEDLFLIVIQKLKHATELALEQLPARKQASVLYHVALYANAVQKPRYGISLCYIVINQPGTPTVDRDLADQLLTEIKLKLPEDIYNAELQKTTLDVNAALQDAHDWLTRQESHASQPPTKHVFNSDLIKKKSKKKAHK